MNLQFNKVMFGRGDSCLSVLRSAFGFWLRGLSPRRKEYINNGSAVNVYIHLSVRVGQRKVSI